MQNPRTRIQKISLICYEIKSSGKTSSTLSISLQGGGYKPQISAVNITCPSEAPRGGCTEPHKISRPPGTN